MLKRLYIKRILLLFLFYYAAGIILFLIITLILVRENRVVTLDIGSKNITYKNLDKKTMSLLLNEPEFWESMTYWPVFITKYILPK